MCVLVCVLVCVCVCVRVCVCVCRGGGVSYYHICHMEPVIPLINMRIGTTQLFFLSFSIFLIPPTLR